jgi:hypothetical protein
MASSIVKRLNRDKNKQPTISEECVDAFLSRNISEIVPDLPGLSTQELIFISEYESKNSDRSTLIGKIQDEIENRG